MALDPGAARALPDETPGWWSDFWKAFVSGIGAGPFENWAADFIETTGIRVASSALHFLIEASAAVSIALTRALQGAEEQSGDALLQMAVYGINAMFGTELGPGAVPLGGGPAAHAQLGLELGDTMIAGLFAGVGGGGEGPNQDGTTAAKKLLGFNLAVALAGYAADAAIPPVVKLFVPGLTDLKEVVLHASGLGRVTRRALQPFVQELITIPLTRQLKRTYLTTELSAGELARLYNRRAIDQPTYFSEMSALGYTHDRAADLLVMNSKELGRSELQAMLRLGLIDEAAVRDALTAAGFAAGAADSLLLLTQEERVLTAHEEVLKTGIAMYAAHEQTDDELAALLVSLKLSQPEQEAYKALAALERSRPKRLTASEVQTAYDEDLWTLDQVHGWLSQEGYNDPDTATLSSIIVKRKVSGGKSKATAAAGAKGPKPGEISKPDAVGLYVAGIVDEAGLVGLLEKLDFTDEPLNLEVLAAKDKKAKALAAAARKHTTPEYGVHAKQGTIEEAFTRGLVSVDELRKFYLDSGFAPGAADLVVQLRELELTASQAKKAKTGAVAAPKPKN